jgi:adenylate cyclase
LEATVGWFVSAMRIILPVGCAIHALLVPIFLALNVPVLALVNVGSLLVWCLAGLLGRSRDLYLGTTLAMFEVFAHAWVCVAVLGWEAGFQYYLLGALVSFFLFPGKRIGSYTAIGLALLEFAILFALRDRPPAVTLDVSTLATMSIVNIVFAFALSMLTALHHVHVAERAEKALQGEYARSEALLGNVMPTAIAARLKRSEATIADSFPEASVLFADIAGFTELSQTLTPVELVNKLDRIFSAFDELVERHGVEKIKTSATRTWPRRAFPSRGPIMPRRSRISRWACNAPWLPSMRACGSGSGSTQGRWSPE